MPQTNNKSKDRAWLMRTYSGHSSAKASNELYRTNLNKGQTGLSVAFDLPTQIGYDPDHPMALGEVGKVGVPIGHIEDMDQLFRDIPLEKMNTSMTINATAMWLYSLYVALAERRGIDISTLTGTIQNDIIKEYLSRGTYVFPPEPSMRLIVDTISYSVKNTPKWNPINICSYHLQEAGATPVQELAYSLSAAISVLDAVKSSGQIEADKMAGVVGRISFFLNAGIRFVEESCKTRAFVDLWDTIAKDRYRVDDPKMRRFRYGLQVNSLGLSEQQPENNVPRIVLEMLGAVLSKNARARAIQLPAWNEALGLPRPWDQQWALRTQQIVAEETDLLEYGDIFDGSVVIEQKVNELIENANREIESIQKQGGILSSIENGYIKQELVKSQTLRMRSIERGDTVVVGVNKYTETADSPLTQGSDGGILKVDPKLEKEQIQAIEAFRKKRNADEIKGALQNLEDAAKNGVNMIPASIRCAHVGVTTGEWAQTLRRVFGEFRAPTGITIVQAADKDSVEDAKIRQRVKEVGEKLGRPIKLLVAKPGLDGHSNGAEQIAVKAREMGLEVVYEGIRLSPAQIAVSALEEGVHIIGLSVLSGSHVEMVRAVLGEMKKLDLNLPVVVGGIIPEADEKTLQKLGVSAVYTPKDSNLSRIMDDLVGYASQATL